MVISSLLEVSRIVKSEGDIDPINGGVGVAEAIFECPDYNIRAPIPFYIDTGCSRTTLGHLDALNAKVPFDKLEVSGRPVDTANGEVFLNRGVHLVQVLVNSTTPIE